MIELVENPLPSMPKLPPLWAVHIRSFDHLLAMPSRRDADKVVKALNAFDEQDDPGVGLPRYDAVVVEWTGSREAHVKALIEQEEQW